MSKTCRTFSHYKRQCVLEFRSRKYESLDSSLIQNDLYRLDFYDLL